jgi:diacylglycerol kinase (ATP)
MPPNHPVFIVNPAAGGGRAEPWWRRKQTQVLEVLPQALVWFTKESGQAQVLSAKALAGGASQVVAVGGDGTANEILNGFYKEGALINPEASLGILPVGSGSDFAKSLGLTSFKDGLQRVVENQGRAVDVGVANSALGRRYFLNAATFGFGAEVVHKMGQGGGKRWLGGLAYQLAALRTLPAWENVSIQVRIDEQDPVAQLSLMGAVCKGKFVGGGMALAPDAQLADGKLQCTMVGDLKKLPALAAMRKAAKGERLDISAVKYHAGKSIQVQASEEEKQVPLELDGEAWGYLPVTLGCAQGPRLSAFLKPHP